jgi:hypothetical protein
MFEDYFALNDHESDYPLAFLRKVLRAIPEAIVGKDPRVHLSGERKYEIVRVPASGSLVHGYFFPGGVASGGLGSDFRSERALSMCF